MTNARTLALGALSGTGAGYLAVRSFQAWNLLRGDAASARRDERNAAAYGRLRRRLAVAGTLRSLAGATAVGYGPLSTALSSRLAPLPRWLRPAAFSASLALAGAIAELPVEFVEDFAVERAHGLSEQRAREWFSDALKGSALAGALAGILGLLGGYVVRTFPRLWPVVATAGMLPLLCAANVVVPLYVLPLFNTFEPLQGPLEVRLRALATRFGAGRADILRMNMSRQTAKANAFVTGIARTHRVVLGDTLVEHFEPDEIEFVVAHEFGHYVAYDTWRAIAAATFAAGLLLLGASAFVDVREEDDGIALARILAWVSCGSVLLRPAMAAYSRSREWAADRFALQATKNPRAGIAAFVRLRDRNCAEDDVPAWFEFFFGSHPSLGKRIGALERS